MPTIHRKWYIIGFNLVACLIFLQLITPQMPSNSPFSLSQSTHNQLVTNYIATPDFQMAGRWSIRFLIMSLVISPLVYLMNWRNIVPLRKWAGLWAFAFAGLHLVFFFNDYAWRKIWGQDFVWVGLVAIGILAVLALTSHQAAMRLLGRNWKRLHRFVYLASILVVLHGINGILHWQKLPDYNAALSEMQIYGFIIAILLILRVPMIRQQVRTILRLPKPKRGKIKSTA